MKISILSFTKNGRELSIKVKEMIRRETELFCKSRSWQEDCGDIRTCGESLSDWTGKQFEQGNAVLFIGACAIAVRAVAPHLKSKLEDVPVLVMDEAGEFVIPILSGHYGGANSLAVMLAQSIGARAVITTATDIRHKFAVDVFAKENHLTIYNKEGIQKISSAVLAGEAVTIAVDGHFTGQVPEELTYLSLEQAAGASVLISPFRRPGRAPKLQLCPRVFILGIGCRRGKTAEELKQAVEYQLLQLEIPREALAGIASIDLKKEEKGLCELAKQYNLPFYTFSPEELQETEGSFTVSTFVENTTGVDNVCERAAVAGCKEGGRLLLKKQSGNGITVAVAEKEWSVCFHET